MEIVYNRFLCICGTQHICVAFVNGDDKSGGGFGHLVGGGVWVSVGYGIVDKESWWCIHISMSMQLKSSKEY